MQPKKKEGRFTSKKLPLDFKTNHPPPLARKFTKTDEKKRGIIFQKSKNGKFFLASSKLWCLSLAHGSSHRVFYSHWYFLTSKQHKRSHLIGFQNYLNYWNNWFFRGFLYTYHMLNFLYHPLEKRFFLYRGTTFFKYYGKLKLSIRRSHGVAVINSRNERIKTLWEIKKTQK